MFSAFAGDKINGLRERIALQKLSFAFSRLFFPGRPGGSRPALKFASFRAAPPIVFPTARSAPDQAV
jgi:hypothetical protein